MSGGANAFRLTRRIVAGDIYQYTCNPMSLGYYLIGLNIAFLSASKLVNLYVLLGIIPAHLFASSLSFAANWEDPLDDADKIALIRMFIEDMREFSDGSRYLNFACLREEGADLTRQGYGNQYERLARLKKKHVPTNLFRLNQNIEFTA